MSVTQSPLPFQLADQLAWQNHLRHVDAFDAPLILTVDWELYEAQLSGQLRLLNQLEWRHYMVNKFWSAAATLSKKHELMHIKLEYNHEALQLKNILRRGRLLYLREAIQQETRGVVRRAAERRIALQVLAGEVPEPPPM